MIEALVCEAESSGPGEVQDLVPVRFKSSASKPAYLRQYASISSFPERCDP